MQNIIVCESEEQLEDIVDKHKNSDFYYVDKSYIFKFPICYLSINRFLRFKGTGFNNRFNELMELFGLNKVENNENRTDRGIRYLGNYKWLYSAMIGICDGKKVIIYPVIRKREMPYRVYRLNLLIDYIKNHTDIMLVIRVEKDTDISELNL